MSDVLSAFQRRHRDKLAQMKREGAGEVFLDELQLFISDLQRAGTIVADPAERVQLRALMRFWGNVIYEHTDIYPDISLHPLDPNRAPPPAEETRRPLPPLIWLLVGGAAAIALAAGLVLIGWLTKPAEEPEPTLVPFVSTIAVGQGVDAEGTLEGISDIFCFGVDQIVARMELQDMEPEKVWRWEVRREGRIVAGQPAVPWGTNPLPESLRILSGDSGGVPPGEYNLLVYVDERVVGAHRFQVLDVPPQVLGLRISDVPDPAEETGSRIVLQEGTRTIYLTYEHVGLCPDVSVVHALYREDDQVQKIVRSWTGTSQGRAQVTFQTASSSFETGPYRLEITVAGERQVDRAFSIGEVRTGSPDFSKPLISLGMEPDGTPILSSADNVFSWNTRVIYGIFEYQDIVEGTSWAAVWRRYGQVVSREERLWDEETDGTDGVRWVVYYAEGGIPLPGGAYSLTLYLDDVAQETSDFRILFYVPPEETEEPED